MAKRRQITIGNWRFVLQRAGHVELFERVVAGKGLIDRTTWKWRAFLGYGDAIMRLFDKPAGGDA